MVQLNKKFDSSQHDDFGSYEAVPAGEYIAQIISSERRDTKAKDGWMIVFVWKVLAGEHQGAEIYDNCNLGNKSQKAVDVANKQLSSICRAVGRVVIQDTEEVHGKPCRITVTVKENPEYGKQNRIKSYQPVHGNIPASSKPAEDPGGEPDGNEEPKKKAPWDDD